MKITKQIPAILLGILFVAFGLAFFFKLMPAPENLNTDEQSFMALFGGTGYMKFVKVLEVAFGALLLIPKTRALGLILIAPIIVNIACYEMFIHKAPSIGFALLILNAVGIFLNKEKYQSIIA
jgi:putative oxidoreductase